MADAGRVIAGSARGRRLVAPGDGTRPLADRVKQTLFAILEPDLPGAAFLDLCAGSGAAGIEALSRGAARATFVERDRRAATTIAENLYLTGLAGPTAGHRPGRGDGLAGRRCGRATARSISSSSIRPTPRPICSGGSWRCSGPTPMAGASAPGARVVAKHFWRDRPPAAVGLLASERDRRFGETGLTFYRREGG